VRIRRIENPKNLKIPCRIAQHHLNMSGGWVQPPFLILADPGEKKTRELERVAQDLEGEVRQLREQLLHPTGHRGGPSRPLQPGKGQQQHVGKLEADLEAVLHEKDLQRARIRDLEASMRQLKVPARSTNLKDRTRCNETRCLDDECLLSGFVPAGQATRLRALPTTGS
jgi:hypothetical protein